ncbi:MAG: hypothetical protein ABI168_09255 [Ginsengibacter sp.]
MKKIFFISLGLLVSAATQSQTFVNNVSNAYEKESQSEFEQLTKTTTAGLNIFIFTRERKNKIDLLAFYTLLRARVKSLFHQKEFYVINARSSKDATAEIERILHERKKFIKNIWFDSHGHYGNRYSSFRIGTDQFSYKNIHDTNAINSLRVIAKYCDENTKVGLGSCYAGADFYFHPRTKK